MANDRGTPRQCRSAGVMTPCEQWPDGSLRQLEETDRDERPGPFDHIQDAGFRDALAIGFDRGATIAVWVGRPDPAATAITERSRATFAHVAFHRARGRNSSDDRWARGGEDTSKLAAFTVLLNLDGPTDVKEHRWTRCSSSW